MSNTYNDIATTNNNAFPLNKRKYPEPTSSVPRQLDVLEFAQARAIEISSLHNVLRLTGKASTNNTTTNNSNTSNAGGGRRTFQTLPRHMRRRAMSHNYYRLPVRFQYAAKREMTQMNTQTKTLSSSNNTVTTTITSTTNPKTPKQRRLHARRQRRISTSILAQHANRQKTNCWLETHLWHAKRMHMSNLWQYKLSLTTTDKSYRATYKANLHTCTLFDASFIQPIQVRVGSVMELVEFMSVFNSKKKMSGVLGASIYVDGSREGSVELYQPNQYPFGLIAPVQFQYRPTTDSKNSTSNTVSNRQIWFWCHASVYDELLALIQFQATAYNSKNNNSSIEVESLRGQLCRFELRGSRTQSILQLVLRSPVFKQPTVTPSTTNSPSRNAPEPCDLTLSQSIWNCFAMNNLRSSASLPHSVILGLTVQHPDTLMHRGRVKQPFTIEAKSKLTYSTRQQLRHLELQTHTNNTNITSSSSHMSELMGYLSSWPSGVSESSLWESEFRMKQTLGTAWGQRKQAYKHRLDRKIYNQKKNNDLTIGTSMNIEPEKVDDSMQVEQSKPLEATPVSKNQTKKRRLFSRNKRPSKFQKSNANTTNKNNTKPLSSIRISTRPPRTLLGTKGGTVRRYINDPSILPSILIIQRSANTTTNTNTDSSSRGIGSGYDLILPAGLAMSFWRCLVYAGCRSIGLLERSRFSVENNQSVFPDLYCDSYSGLVWENYRGEKWKNQFRNRPSSKRVNFWKLAVKNPFQVDWKGLCQSSSSSSSGGDSRDPADSSLFASYDWKSADSKPCSSRIIQPQIHPTLHYTQIAPATFATPTPSTTTDTTTNTSTLSSLTTSSVHSTLRHRTLPYYIHRSYTRYTPLTQLIHSFIHHINHCLISVRITCLSKGKPTDLASIVRPTMKDLQSIKKAYCQWSGVDEPIHTNTSSSGGVREVIGYLNTGMFSYREGQGIGIGCITATSLVSLLKEQQLPLNMQVGKMSSSTDRNMNLYVLVRNNTSVHYRPAKLQIRV